MSTYGDRNILLKEMGYDSYQVYLASPLWSKIRTRAWRLHGKFCVICRSPAKILHHVGYGKDVLLGSNLKPLVPVCPGCHKKIEFHPRKGKKRTLVEAQTAFARLKKAYHKRRRLVPMLVSKSGYWVCCGRKWNPGEDVCPRCAHDRKLPGHEAPPKKQAETITANRLKHARKVAAKARRILRAKIINKEREERSNGKPPTSKQ